jgi:hypothetical protein
VICVGYTKREKRLVEEELEVKINANNNKESTSERRNYYNLLVLLYVRKTLTNEV